MTPPAAKTFYNPVVELRPFSLAIETSGRVGSITLGRGEEMVDSFEMPAQQRHTVDLMPAIDRLCRAYSVAPSDLADVYVSIGPGSFTGLRIGVATAKMLAYTLRVKLVAVPTIDAVAQNAPADAGTLAVCLNLKGDTVYTALYHYERRRWRRSDEPELRTMAELLASAPRPLAILGDPLPRSEAAAAEGVTILPAAQAAARSEAVWSLGRRAAGRGDYTDAKKLMPLYVRPVEAEELWNKRHPAG